VPVRGHGLQMTAEAQDVNFQFRLWLQGYLLAIDEQRLRAGELLQAEQLAAEMGARRLGVVFGPE
jgi:hypothetical protein